MQPHDAGRVDQHIPAALVDIARCPMRLLSFHKGQRIDPPGFWPPHVPEGSGEHAVVAVGLTRLVNQQRPGQTGFLDVLTGKKVIIKGDDDNPDIAPAEFRFLITQLRDVRPAGQSAKMAVEDHQQPAPGVLSQAMAAAEAVVKVERKSRFSDQIDH